MAILKGKANKVAKILLMIWVIISGLLTIIVGVVHFTENGWLSYVAPSKLNSQPGFALSLQAVVCCLYGFFLILMPFSAFFKKIPCIKKITVSYNRITLMMFYAVGGFIVFSLCGIFGLVVACLLWVSFVIVFLMLFLTTSISNFDSSSSSSSSSSDHKKKLKGKEMSSSSD